MSDQEPNCDLCVHKKSIAGNAHIACTNAVAKVEGNKFGVERGWFLWPLNFDPVWLKSCDGFKQIGGG